MSKQLGEQSTEQLRWLSLQGQDRKVSHRQLAGPPGSTSGHGLWWEGQAFPLIPQGRPVGHSALGRLRMVNNSWKKWVRQGRFLEIQEAKAESDTPWALQGAGQTLPVTPLGKHRGQSALPAAPHRLNPVQEPQLTAPRDPSSEWPGTQLAPPALVLFCAQVLG